MNDTLLRSWWMLASRGVIAIVFGLLALLWPGPTLFWLLVLFASFSLLGGAVWSIGAVCNRHADTHWWVLLAAGLASIGAGLSALLYPTLTALVLIMLMGAHALVSGLFDLVLAVRLHTPIRGEVLMALSGVLSVAFGVVVFLYPRGGDALALVWLVSLYAVATGALCLIAAARVRTWSRLNRGRSSPAAGAR
jgi:uncharacterized membrane protein HdeD (DUF308 family)